MYLKSSLIANSGSIEHLEIEFGFTSDGNPKPTVLVGKNGAGKTNFLSYIVDGIVEIASKKFSNITRTQGFSRQYFRVSSSETVRVGQNFEFGALLFDHDGERLTYYNKQGAVLPEHIKSDLGKFGLGEGLKIDSVDRNVTCNLSIIEGIFRNEAHLYFPSERSESPSWRNEDSLSDDYRVDFSPSYIEKLDKNIISVSSLKKIKPWIIDVILDQSVDGHFVLHNYGKAIELALQANGNINTLRSINFILSEILEDENARIIRVGRDLRNHKLQVVNQEKCLLPCLDSFSAGQSNLFTIFSNIVKHGDIGVSSIEMSEIRGIVIIDEIDMRLHSDLQYFVLPRLIKRFPKVQFIVTAHSPLFLMGMEKEFGEGFVDIFELPSGVKIDSERYSEFHDAFEKMKNTANFFSILNAELSKSEKPLILCEGETDPIYIRKAASVLGFQKIVDEIEIDSIGISGPQGSVGAGSGGLKAAEKLLRENPRFIKSKVLLLYDSDQSKITDSQEGKLTVKKIERNQENNKCVHGIENLLHESALEERFFHTKTNRQGTKTVTVTDIKDKRELCSHVCENLAEVNVYEGFRSILVFIENWISNN
jgi:predicted ATP-binding protein involved in virulence